jgi:hypothetical protein
MQQMSIWRMRVAFRKSKATRVQAHAHTLATHIHAQLCTHARAHTQQHVIQRSTKARSTATMVTWTRLSATLYVHVLFILSSIESRGTAFRCSYKGVLGSKRTQSMYMYVYSRFTDASVDL